MEHGEEGKVRKKKSGRDEKGKADRKRMIVDYLLTSLSKWKAAEKKDLLKRMAEQTGVSKKQVNEYLYELIHKDHMVAEVITVNHFKTPYKFEYRIGLRLSPSVMAEQDFTVTSFLKDIMTSTPDNIPEGEKHFHIIEGIALRGGNPHDILLTVLADNAHDGLEQLEGCVLRTYSFIEDVTTLTVSHSYSRGQLHESPIATKSKVSKRQPYSPSPLTGRTLLTS